jgi:uncharacterized lipoprotein YmbA
VKDICTMKLATLITATAACLLLNACGSSPQVRYFGLETIAVEYQRDPDGAPVVGIGPLRIPDYLKRSQMVTRGQGAELIVDDYHRWAEGLEEAIHRSVATNVDSLVKSAVVVAFPTSSLVDVDYRMIGRINRFDTDTDGLAVLDVQWGVGSSAGETVVRARRSHYESRASAAGDPAAAALAMSDALEQFSREIAREIEAILD